MCHQPAGYRHGLASTNAAQLLVPGSTAGGVADVRDCASCTPVIVDPAAHAKVQETGEV